LKAAVYLTMLSALLCTGPRAQHVDDAGDASPPAPVLAAASLSEKLPHPDEKYFLRHLALDQLTIWTSPAHVTADDAKWLVPSAGIATGLFVTDPDSSFGMASYHPQHVEGGLQLRSWRRASNSKAAAGMRSEP